MIYKIIDGNDPSLLNKVPEFDFSTPPTDPIELANNLIETMVAGRGIGLSANQCGLPHRVFVLYSAQPLVCFNPRVIDQTTEQISLEESCLSFPGMMLPIKRSKVIKVRFQDAAGEMHTEKFIGMTARQFLHELDHLNGVVYTRHANPAHIERAKRKAKQIQRQNKKVA